MCSLTLKHTTGLVAFFMSGATAFCQSDALALSSGATTPGGTVSLNLSLSSPSGSQPAGIEWTFVYLPSDIFAISASAGAAATAAGKSLSCAGSPGSYLCLLTGLNGNVIQNGVVAVLTVTLSAASSGATISVTNALSAPTARSAIQTTATGGTITTGVPLSLTSLRCNPGTVASGASTTCTVSLNQSASSGTTVTLSDNNALLTVPASVTVPANSTSTTFTATVGTITTTRSATLTATLNRASQSTTLSLAAPMLVSALGCNSSSVNSGASPTCTVTLNQSAPTGGTVVALSDNNASLTVPALLTIAASATSATFTATVGTIITTQSATITATLNRASQSTTLSLAAPMLVSALACNPTSINSGASTTCTVTLNQSAPTGGSAVALSSNNTALTMSASVTVPANSTSTTFTATVGAIITTQSATITATLNRASQSTTLSLAAPMLVSALGCNSSSVNSGASTTCTVTLNQSAPTGGTVVALSDNNASLTVPALLTIAASATSATFTATVGTIITTRSATITATLNRASQTARLTLVAPVLISALACNTTTLDAGASSTCTLTLSAPAPAGGVIVSVSANGSALTVPASVNVPAGSATAAFSATATTEPSGGESTEAVSVTATLDGASQSESFTLIICPCSLWPSTAQPLNPASTNKQAIEVGMQFTSNVSGYVTGVRFFKALNDTGTHVGHLWSPKGKLLAAVTFTDETKSGWQLAYFPSPVAVVAKTTYVISYNAPNGNYAADSGFFTNALSNPPLFGLADGENGPSGVYQYGSGGFPATGASATNFWVDPVFNTSPTIGTVTPVSLWTPEAVPNTATAPTWQATQLGLTFVSSVPGYATGLRFYKSATNTGPHRGYLWTSTGTLLASVVFPNESASGWQQANFATPVAIEANTPYVVSYWCPAGQYAADAGYFATSGITTQMLYAPPDGQYGPNGSYATSNAFPASSSGSSNYWVDVVFSTAIQ